VTHDGTHALRVRLAQLHTVLSAAHFTRRHHFHRTGDLLSALNTRDLGANFLASSHSYLPGLRRLKGINSGLERGFALVIPVAVGLDRLHHIGTLGSHIAQQARTQSRRFWLPLRPASMPFVSGIKDAHLRD